MSGLPAAVLFDLDGTLVDSEPLHFLAYRRFMASVGVTVHDSDLIGNIGKGDLQFVETLMRRNGISADPQIWLDGKTATLMALYREGELRLRPGAREALDAVERLGLRCSIVTSSIRDLAALALEVTGISSRLPMRVVSEDVVRHKPAPDPYLLAARNLGVDPRTCWALEDSVSGVRSAKAAGCTVFAASGIVPDADLLAAGADHVSPDLHLVVRMLGPGNAKPQLGSE